MSLSGCEAYTIIKLVWLPFLSALIVDQHCAGPSPTRGSAWTVNQQFECLQLIAFERFSYCTCMVLIFIIFNNHIHSSTIWMAEITCLFEFHISILLSATKIGCSPGKLCMSICEGNDFERAKRDFCTREREA